MGCCGGYFLQLPIHVFSGDYGVITYFGIHIVFGCQKVFAQK